MSDAVDAPTPPQDASGEGKGEPRTKRLDFAARAVLMRYLQAHPDLSTYAIAERTGHSPHTVKAYRGQLGADIKAMTAAVMQTDVLPALEEWAAARTVSALKGDHRPSKEWLIAAQAIDPDTARASVAVGFQVVLAPSPGTPAYVNASATTVVSETPAVQRVPPAAPSGTTPHDTPDQRDSVPTSSAEVLRTQPPHGNAYIAPSTPDAVRTPLDAGGSTPAPAPQRTRTPRPPRLRR